MENKNLIIFFGLILLTFNFVSAVPNPAAVYCSGQGFDLEIRETEEGQYGVCVFPDGSECGEWDYYCKCDPEGNGCWSGADVSCDYLCEESLCKNAGESSFVFGCCDGLEEIKPTGVYDEECNFLNGMTGWTYVCSDCGNGVCEEWENICNCPEDCEQEEIKLEEETFLENIWISVKNFLEGFFNTKNL